MFIFLAFRTKAKKLNLPAAKFYHFLLGRYKKRFDSIIQPNHIYDKFPAVFGGIMLDHFLLESDPEKNLINPVNPVFKKIFNRFHINQRDKH
jgi:hypothetical protein